jgi:hypothetical protein
MNVKELLFEYYDPADDEAGRAKMDDTRRPRLTMHHLQKLRKSRDIEKYEKAQHVNFLPDMYGQSAEQDPGGMAGLGGM